MKLPEDTPVHVKLYTLDDEGHPTGESRELGFGTVTHVAICDAPSGGKPIAYGNRTADLSFKLQFRITPAQRRKLRRFARDLARIYVPRAIPRHRRRYRR